MALKCYRMNKKGDVTVLLLVVFVVILVSWTLFIFNTNTNSVAAEIKDSRFLDRIYFREGEISFYINRAMDRAVSQGRGDFIKNFRESLDSYESSDEKLLGDLKRAVEEITEESVSFEGSKVTFNIRLKLTDRQDRMIVSHLYEENFVREFESED